MDCPKCGAVRAKGMLECNECGVIYGKYNPGISKYNSDKAKYNLDKINRMERLKAPLPAKEKSLPLAIGLNFLAPGIGYIYFGKWVVGILAFFIIVGIYATSGIFFLFSTWLAMNIIMSIDMMILNNKNNKKVIEQNTKKCPECAEIIQREAKVCRFCGIKLETSAARFK